MIDAKRIVESAIESLNADREAIRAALAAAPRPPGLEKPDDATFLAFVDGMRRQWPPEPLILPDGRTVVESPWIAALPYVDGGMEIVKRIETIGRRVGA